MKKGNRGNRGTTGIGPIQGMHELLKSAIRLRTSCNRRGKFVAGYIGPQQDEASYILHMQGGRNDRAESNIRIARKFIVNPERSTTSLSVHSRSHLTISAIKGIAVSGKGEIFRRAALINGSLSGIQISFSTSWVSLFVIAASTAGPIVSSARRGIEVGAALESVGETGTLSSFYSCGHASARTCSVRRRVSFKISP
ncbi:hypothetical protein CPB85DRAFT_206160 [Mucidula mucida]|nr:hypothetical protein CPB85DRAFT_206160 [Mucidula mucida]